MLEVRVRYSGEPPLPRSPDSVTGDQRFCCHPGADVRADAMVDHCELVLRQVSKFSRRFNDSNQARANFRSWPIIRIEHGVGKRPDAD